MVGGIDNTPKGALGPECRNLRVKAALNVPSWGPGDYFNLTESEMRPGRTWASASGFPVKGQLQELK